MNIEGQLDIQLSCNTNGVSAATLQSGRPLQASRILEGLSPEQALQRLPMIFSLCGTAQSAAALAACEDALSISASSAQRQARGMLVWMESAREHLLRILLDWPGFAGETVEQTGLPKVMQLLPSMSQALYGESAPFHLNAELKLNKLKANAVIAELRNMIDNLLSGTLPDTGFGMQQWIEGGASMPARLFSQLRDKGWDRLGQSKAVFLPTLNDADLHTQLGSDAANYFISQPVWQGHTCETTPLQRQQQQPLVQELLQREGNALLTRLTARLVELASIPDLLQAGLAALSAADQSESKQRTQSGVGLAQVEAARGRLIHRVEIEAGVIRRYQILAPTEWNFHPLGVAVQGLHTLNSNDEKLLQQQAALWLNAIDPCVGYQIQVHHDA